MHRSSFATYQSSAMNLIYVCIEKSKIRRNKFVEGHQTNQPPTPVSVFKHKDPLWHVLAQFWNITGVHYTTNQYHPEKNIKQV